MINTVDQPFFTASQLQLAERQATADGVIAGRNFAAGDIRSMMLSILPPQLLVSVVADMDVEPSVLIGIEDTLKLIAKAYQEQRAEIADLEQANDHQMRVMKFVADELDLLVESSYTHGQKNGIVMHIAARLRKVHQRRFYMTPSRRPSNDSTDDIPF